MPVVRAVHYSKLKYRQSFRFCYHNWPPASREVPPSSELPQPLLLFDRIPVSSVPFPASRFPVAFFLFFSDDEVLKSEWQSQRGQASLVSLVAGPVLCSGCPFVSGSQALTNCQFDFRFSQSIHCVSIRFAIYAGSAI